MKRTILSALCALALIQSCCRENNFEKLNARAAEEYLVPVRPYIPGEAPCWNTYSRDFKFAPVFDFAPVQGAASYRYTVWQDTATSYVWTVPVMQQKDNRYVKSHPTDLTPGYFRELAIDAPTSVSWSFCAASPNESLAPIWQDIPVGNCRLIVEALDASGKVIATAGDRLFIRDFPFEGPYTAAPRPYRECVLKGCLYVHTLPSTQAWKESSEPDMSYKHNTYACKIIGSVIRLEVLFARLAPSKAEECTQIARSAAAFLMSQAQPEGSPLAYFPPTYYGNEIASAKAENKGTTMMMEAATAGNAFLDLYDLTGEQSYLDFAKGIADTYRRIQRKDGSYPVKVYIETGEPNAESCAMIGPLLQYFQRFKEQYGIEDYADAQLKGESWMKETIDRDFELKGQFEDGSQNGWQPYQNLTNSAGSSFVKYLCSKPDMTKEDMALSEDIMRFNEDQFVHWDALPNRDGFRQIVTPGVYEQYEYRVPIDCSAHNVSSAWIAMYRRNPDELYLQKAKALVDAIANVQDPVSGFIPTTWDLRSHKKNLTRAYWINCTYASLSVLLSMGELLEKEE